MARPTSFKIRSDEIAAELVRVIRDECTLPLALKVARVGAIEAAAKPETFAQVFPAVFVRPSATDATPNNGNQTNFDVVDRYRIAYAVPMPAEEDPLPFALAGLKTIAAALSVDASLAEFAQTIGNDQIVSSLPEAAEFDPPEDAFLDVQVPVKVVVLRWTVTWATC